MLTLALALALGQVDAGPDVSAQDAGTGASTGWSAPLYATCPDAPPTQPLDGGWVLMPPERAARVACLMETCEASRKLAQDASDGIPPPYWWVALAGGIILAGAAGYMVGHLVGANPPQQ